MLLAPANNVLVHLNGRLTIFYNVLLFTLLFLILIDLIHHKWRSTEVPVKKNTRGFGFQTRPAVQHSTSKSIQGWIAGCSQTICTITKGTSMAFTYTNLRCLPGCRGPVNTSCVRYLEAIRSDSEDDIFYTTRLRETLFHLENGTTKKLRNYFLSLEDTFFLFKYNYNLPRKKIQSQDNLQTAAAFEGSSHWHSHNYGRCFRQNQLTC